MPNDFKVKQHIPKELRYSMRDFNNEFPNDAACLEYVKEQRFPNGVTKCAKCGVDRKHYRVGNRTAFACDHCGNHIYPLAGTIFEKSSTPLRLWFYAMYLMGSTRCGISGKQVQREIGVTYKTAWRMFNQIRKLLTDDDLQMEGPTAEIDESYFGGRRKYGFGRTMRGDTKKKQVAVAIVERRGKAIARALDNASISRIKPLVQKHIKPGAVIYTDEAPIYDKLSQWTDKDGNPANYQHYSIKHKDGVYVRGHITTNSVEGLWSLIERGIGGVYHSVSQKHLQGYLNEYCFRYNRRHNGNRQFKMILERASRLS